MNKQAIAETQTQYVQMEKKKLLEAVKQNRTLHIEHWRRAHDKWRSLQIGKLKEYAEELQKAIEAASDGKEIAWPDKRSFQLTEPRSHGKDYDRTVRRLEMSVDEFMYLTHDDFDRYVMDDWSWKREFNMTNSAYVESPAAG